MPLTESEKEEGRLGPQEAHLVCYLELMEVRLLTLTETLPSGVA